MIIKGGDEADVLIRTYSHDTAAGGDIPRLVDATMSEIIGRYVGKDLHQKSAVRCVSRLFKEDRRYAAACLALPSRSLCKAGRKTFYVHSGT